MITGLCFKVHRKLGRFCTERQYCDEIEKLLKEFGHIYKREAEISNIIQNSPAGNRVDFIVEDKIILEIKAKKFVTKEDYIQTVRYLEAAGLGLALLINFRHTYLKPKRIINSNFDSGNSGADSGYSGRQNL
jgi:GxxExxY protein